MAVRLSDTTITIRVPQQEKDLVTDYCEKHRRSQTDVLRELIRSLEDKS
jgi:Ribbon-helix-helix protein, copG family